MSASLKSIAEDLKLSKTTISWILAGKGKEKGFSDKRIEEVLKYAEKVNYKPNMLAKSLSLGHSKTIGLIIPTVQDTFYSQMAEAIESVLSERGYIMMLGTSENDPEKEKNLISTFLSFQVAGLVIAPTTQCNETIQQMRNDNYPFVLIDRFIPGIVSDYVIVNNEKAIYDLTCSLMEAGYQHTGILLVEKHLYVMEKRYKGYLKALKDAGKQVNKDMTLLINRQEYEQDVAKKLEKLLSDHPETDSFLFTTHYLAEAALKYFISHGIEYKNRFKMGCIHYSKALEILSPEMLKSIMPIELMGRKAVEIILQKLDDPYAPIQEIQFDNI